MKLPTEGVLSKQGKTKTTARLSVRTTTQFHTKKKSWAENRFAILVNSAVKNAL